MHKTILKKKSSTNMKSNAITSLDLQHIKKLSSEENTENLLEQAYTIIKEKEKELNNASKIREHILSENSKLKQKINEIEESYKSLNTSGPKFKSNLYNSPELDIFDPTPTKLNKLKNKSANDNNEEIMFELEQKIITLQESLEAEQSQKREYIINENKLKIELEKERLHSKSQMEDALNKIKELENIKSQLLMDKKSNHKEKSIVGNNRPKSLFYPKNDINSSINTNSDNESEPNQSSDNQSNNNDNYHLIQDLLLKIKELETTNRNLSKKKREVEESMKKMQTEVENLKKQCEILKETAKQFEIFKQTLERQSFAFNDNSVMNRSTFGRGSIFNMLYTPHSSTSSGPNNRNVFFSSPSPSIRYNNGTSDLRLRSSIQRTLSASSAMSSQFSSTLPKRTLLGELENEFYSQFSNNDNKQEVISNWIKINNYYSNNSSIPFSQSNSNKHEPFNETEELRLSRVDSSVNEEEDDIVEIESVGTKRPFGFYSLIKYIFHVIWKWCKFIALILAAVSVAIYRGPDDSVDYY